MISLTVNGKPYNVDVASDMPLLWVIRDVIGLTGTKFGCGLSQCGACTVHLDGNAVRSCSIPASSAAGKKVTTIEGLSPNSQPRAADRVDRRAGAPVRLLPVGTDHVGRRAAREDAEADRRANRHRDDRQHLPLRHLSTHPPRHQARGRRAGIREGIMNLNRRTFLKTTPRGRRPAHRRLLRRGPRWRI